MTTVDDVWPGEPDYAQDWFLPAWTWNRETLTVERIGVRRSMGSAWYVAGSIRAIGRNEFHKTRDAAVQEARQYIGGEIERCQRALELLEPATSGAEDDGGAGDAGE